MHLSNLKLSRKELGTLNVRDAFNHIRYFLRFTVRKRVSGKKNIYFKVNSAKFIWNAQPNDCPCDAISEGDGKYEINADACVDCGSCAEVCPVGAPQEG